MTTSTEMNSPTVEKMPLLNQGDTSKTPEVQKGAELEIIIDEEQIGSKFTESHDMDELGNGQAIFHILKASIGTGILALPSALHYSGVVLGTSAIIVLSLISIYSVRLLLRVVAHLRSTSPTPIHNLDYEKTVKLCFENATEKLRRFVWLHQVLYVSLVVAQLGFLSSYHIFLADNTKFFVDYYTKSFSLWIYQILFVVVLTPLMFIKTLDKLSYFTHVANILMVISLLTSLVYCLQDPLPLKSLDLIKLSDATPLFFGIIIFSFESINLINPIECHLKNKKAILDTCGVLNVSTSIVLIAYVIIGFSGYWKFGDNIASSLILSIPMQPWYYMLCKPFYIISILINYAIQGYILVTILWKKLHLRFEKDRSKRIVDIGIRIGVVVSTTILSLAIPHFDLFVSLVGAFSGAAITLIIPAIVNSVTVYSTKEDKHWRFQLGINAVIFIIGVLGCVIGTYSSVASIVKVLTK